MSTAGTSPTRSASSLPKDERVVEPATKDSAKYAAAERPTVNAEEARERIEDLAARAEADRAAFDPPADPPDQKRAMEYLRNGAGEAVRLYVDARVDGFVHIPPAAFDQLEGAMNDWLELYAACYGVEMDADFTVRKAAELLLETHNIKDTAVMLTQVGYDV